MTLTSLPQSPDALLDAAEETALQRDIEAGLLARDALESGAGFADASPTELALIAERGERARQRFVRANLGLVGLVVRQHPGRVGGGGAELYQEGCVGLMTAVERFDHARGLRFSTYALFWIRAQVGDAVARLSAGPQLPTSRARQLRKARGRETGLAQELGRPPTVPEVAVALGRSEGWTAGVLSHERPDSLDGCRPSVLECARSRQALDAVLDGSGAVRSLLDHLDGQQRRLLGLRLGFHGRVHSRTETARVLALTVGQVRRMEEEALERLRAVCPYQLRDEL